MQNNPSKSILYYLKSVLWTCNSGRIVESVFPSSVSLRVVQAGEPKNIRKDANLADSSSSPVEQITPDGKSVEWEK